jgi:hypothetical protein
MPKRDPYYNNPDLRAKFLADVKEDIRKRKPIQWICWCGNIVDDTIEWWSGTMICSVCKRRMKRRKDV